MFTIDTFVKDMMLEAGFAPTELFDDVVEEAANIVLDRLTIHIVSKLDTDEDKVQFMDMIEDELREDAMAFAEQHIADYDNWMMNILGQIKKEYLQDMKEGI